MRILAADGAQEAHVIGRLHALRHDLLAELVPERHDRAHDGRACAVLRAGRLHQSPVDLDRVEGKPLQVGQRGVAGAEVVEREFGTGAAQPFENLGRLLGILHHEAFGDLQTQRALGYDVAPQNVTDLLDQVLAEDLAAGDVDAHEERILLTRQLALPARGLVRGTQEHVRAEPHDEVGLLGQRYEIVGAHEPELGMLPAHQRLESRQLLGGQVDDRLVEHADLVLGERLAQIALQRDAVVAVGAHIGPEDLDSVGAAALGAVHGNLGLLVEIEMTGLAPVVDGDAERARQHDLLAGDLDGRAQRSAHALCQGRKLLRAMVGGQQDCELIAADPPQRVLGAEMALQPASDRQQQAVADDQAERHVDALELVDVDENDARPRAVLALCPHDGDAEAVEQQLAVGQPGQTVVHGVVQQPFVRPLGVRHVADQPHAAQRARIRVGDARGLQLEPAVAVVGMTHAEVGADLRPRALLHGPQDQPVAVAIGRMQMLDEILDLGRQLAGAQSQRRLDHGADLDLVAPGVPLPHRRPGAIDGERAQLKLAGGGAVERLQRAERELGHGKSDEDENEDEAGDERGDDDVAGEPPGEHHGGAEDPDQEQDPRRDEGQRSILTAEG